MLELSPDEIDLARRAMSPILGEPLSDMWRYGEFQRFEFGAQKPFLNKKGQEVAKAD